MGKEKYIFEGKKFRSPLEIDCIKLLRASELVFLYEPYKITLLEGFTPLVNIYLPQDKKMILQVKKDGKENKKIQAMTYTPDFWYEDDKRIIIIETKGYANQVYPYKRKLFFKLLNGNEISEGKQVYFFEPSKVIEIEETIKIIKQILDETN